MAMTQFNVNSAQSRKVWSDMLAREVLEDLWFAKFMGTDNKSIVQKMTELERGRGDEIRYDLLVQMSGEGVTGSNTLWDNEEALTFYQDTIKIDQLRNAHKFDLMSQQRTVHELMKLAKENLKDWFARKMDQYMFRSLGGDTTFTFAGNTGTAPDNDHYMLCGSSVAAKSGTIATDEASLGSSDRIKLEDINYIKEIARGVDPRLRPVRIDGGEYFAMTVHDYVATDLKLNTGGSTLGAWQDIAKQADPRGSKNRIWEGALGIYDGVILYQSENIYSPSANIYRNILLGAQAATIAFGNAYSKSKQNSMGKDSYFSWSYQNGDYEDKEGVSAGSVFGIKKTRFNSKDFGCVTMSAYSGIHR